MPGACDRRATQRGGMPRRSERCSYFRTGPDMERPCQVACYFETAAFCRFSPQRNALAGEQVPATAGL
jgi:hypothetical protein